LLVRAVLVGSGQRLQRRIGILDEKCASGAQGLDH
jgi:hypothetical protein